MDRPGLCRVLLELVGTTGEPAPGQLDDADWAELDLIAGAHRLRPLLYANHHDNAAIPAALRTGWQAARRAATMQAMVQRAELTATHHVLIAAGIDALVMKGGWLAWHAYPEAALRPLRDIDLLVPTGQLWAAWLARLAAGYRQAEAFDLPVDQLLAVDKSLPVLLAPHGTAIELHQHAWFPEGRLEYTSPPPDDAGLFARAARTPEGPLHPSAEDMLAHLVIHAVYSHRLDCGPLLLPDIDYLLRAGPFDWDAFWGRAVAANYAGGARLVLDLVQRYRAPPGLDLAAAPVPATPPALLDAARELLLQDLSTRLSAGVAAAGPRGLWRRLTRRVEVKHGAAVHRDSARDGGYFAWATDRLARTLGDLANPAVRRQSRQLAQLSRWLDR